ncbi:MAG: SulP family inorganic anion transporter [Leptospira sp.]|nr:SulP family inorganic anion transporter [Leptospira sp.]
MNFANWKKDLPASLVVFLVALPLCLGIALASGAPLYAGILSGIIGGIVVGSLSGSHLSVSGPAAGLTVIVFRSIESLDSYSVFLYAVLVAGFFQIILGILRAGVLSSFFPYSVIKGMLAAIGIILIIKQIPVAFGFEKFSWDMSFTQANGNAFLVTAVALFILIIWDSKKMPTFPFKEFVPGALIAVIWGLLYQVITRNFFPAWSLDTEQLVQLPVLSGWAEFKENIFLPDFSQWQNWEVYKIAGTIAIIASLESLLSVEAIDKLDFEKRSTPQNRELFAQGCGNMACGLIGGIPVTAVIIRSSANLNAGAKTKLSAILHGILLLVAVVFLAGFLNSIPLSALSAILLLVGYKLTKPSLIKEFYKKGKTQHIPFFLTIFFILITDLLVGVVLGIIVALIFVLKENYRDSISLIKHKDHYYVGLKKDIFFLNKPEFRRKIESIPDGSQVIIEGHKADFIDQDVLETLEDFIASANERKLDIIIRKSKRSKYPIFRLE